MPLIFFNIKRVILKNLFFAILSLFLFSCSNKGGDSNSDIPLFNDCTFKLHSGELLTESNTATQRLYENYFNNTDIQIPLFKHIKHTEYDIFIGIPVGTSVEGMSKTVLEKHNSTLDNFKKDRNYCYNQYILNGLYITELAIKIDDKSLFYISSITSNKLFVDTLLNYRELSRRILKGKV
jgi:hypothetical protein